MHVWDPAVAPYPWLTPDLSALDRPFALTDVAGALTGCAVDRVVLVQASDSLADTANMFAQAFRGTSGVDVAGIVAWVPLIAPARARQLLEAWAGLPVVGVRHLVHREADPRWLLHQTWPTDSTCWPAVASRSTCARRPPSCWRWCRRSRTGTRT